MSEIAIRVENLSKLYRIGQRDSYLTLRDTLANALRAPFRYLRANGDQWSSADGHDNTIWALKEVSFEVRRGESVGIIGLNGAGKTTLLKILCRITKPTGGYAEVWGRVETLLEVGTGFHPELTGRENIFMNGAILGMKKRELERKFDEIVAFAEVEKFIDTPIKHYSSGMCVRLAFAVAAHLDPEILLVDDVLVVGDMNYQRKCIKKMQELASEERAILFVSHSMSTINLVAKRAIFLDSGRIQKDGPSAEVVAAYFDHSNKQGVVGMTAIGKTAPIDPPDSSTPCRILGVDLLNEEGKGTQAFEFNGALKIRIYYDVFRPVDNPYFGVSIWTDDGVRICTFDSRISGKASLGIVSSEGSAECIIPKLCLLPGLYLVRVRIYDSKTDRPFDSLGWDGGRGVPFYVMSKRDQELIPSRPHGIVDLPATWEVTGSRH